MTNAFEPDLNNFMGRGSTGVPADGDVWAWDEETGRSKPVAAAGGGGDPLHLEQYLSIGAAPLASVGLLRLPFAGEIAWRGFNDDGDYRAFTVHSNYDNENALLLSGLGTHTSFIVASYFNDAADWKGVTLTSIDAGPGTNVLVEMELVDDAGNGVDGSITLAAGAGQEAQLYLSSGLGDALAKLKGDHIVLQTLPTLDPGMGSNELWQVDGAGLAAALGAGSMYVLVHP